MPRSYPVEFRRKVLDLVEAGSPVAEIAERLGVTGQTSYKWRNQDLADRGSDPASAPRSRWSWPRLEDASASSRRSWRSPSERMSC